MQLSGGNSTCKVVKKIIRSLNRTNRPNRPNRQTCKGSLSIMRCPKKGMLSWYWNDFNSRTGPFHLEPYIILYLSTWFRDGAKSLPETFIPFVNSNEIPVVVWHFIHGPMTKSLIKITECLFTCTITSSCSHVRYIHVSLRFHANTAVML